MSDVLFAWGGVHPRTLIRRAVCQVMREHDGLAALIGARIWPNRMEHWFRGELPAAGVYTVSEQRVESDTRPEPQERVISLAVELLGGELEAVDDTLDALCLQAERAVLRLDAIGRAPAAGPRYAPGGHAALHHPHRHRAGHRDRRCPRVRRGHPEFRPGIPLADGPPGAGLFFAGPHGLVRPPR